jgi:hypothetical protein
VSTYQYQSIAARSDASNAPLDEHCDYFPKAIREHPFELNAAPVFFSRDGAARLLDLFKSLPTFSQHNPASWQAISPQALPFISVSSFMGKCISAQLPAQIVQNAGPALAETRVFSSRTRIGTERMANRYDIDFGAIPTIFGT